MISFRYHLVSIVAVFLALALGIVVGTTALSGPITKDLRNQLSDTKKQRDALNAQVKALQGQVGDADQFASTYGPQIVAKSLTGAKVLMVVLPSAPGGMQAGITRQVQAAGGTISGVVTVSQNYLDQRLGSGVESLATGSAHPIAWTAPQTDDAAVVGGSLLAYVLSGLGQKTDVTQVLGGFAALHMVSTDNGTVTPSRLTVVLGGGGRPGGNDGTYAIHAEEALVAAMAGDKAHVVVAGDAASADDKGLVATIRTLPADRDSISTVDDADSAFGQVSTVLALAAASTGQPGHYGSESGADALFPNVPK